MSNKTTIAKYIGLLCAVASIANMFIKSDLLQHCIWLFLCISFLLVIMDDMKTQNMLFELNSKYIKGIMNLERYPDELCKHLRESNEFSEEELDKIETMIWGKYGEVYMQRYEEKDELRM